LCLGVAFLNRLANFLPGFTSESLAALHSGSAWATYSARVAAAWAAGADTASAKITPAKIAQAPFTRFSVDPGAT
jgi:hypothetical protein